AARLGTEVFASDLNPIAVLLERIVLEYVPRYGNDLLQQYLWHGQLLQARVAERIREYFPLGPAGERPLSYLWARTVRCEAPGCGVTVPMIRSMWLLKKQRPTALRFRPEHRKIHIEVLNNPALKDVSSGTMRSGSVTCPICGFTTPNKNARAQLTKAHGG